MRIALVSTPFVSVPPRAYGGTELVVHALHEELVRAGHAVTLFATGDSRSPDLRFAYERPVWPPDADAEVHHCAVAAVQIARERFDVVHAHLPAMVAIADALRAPLVYTLHHDREERLVRLYRSHPAVRYVAISAAQAARHPELACDVVHHGLDPARYPLGAGERRDAAFLGRLSPCKGPDLAVAAARKAGVPLRVAGALHRADADPEWSERVAAALAAPGVTRVGPVGGARKLELLGGAIALLMPIRWAEPFGLVMIEAMLCGTPVVAFPFGAAAEVVDDGVTGYLVEDVGAMAAALARIAAGFDRARCRARAVARFASERMARDYLRVYASALAPRPGPAGPEETRHAG